MKRKVKTYTISAVAELYDIHPQTLEIARDAGMAVCFVLLDHRWMFAGVRHTIADPATGVGNLKRSVPVRAGLRAQGNTRHISGSALTP